MPKRGFRVRQVTFEEVAQAIDIRGALEGLAARTAAESGPDPDCLLALQDCVQEGRGLVDAARDGAALETPRWVAMNVRFHHRLVMSARNPVLAATLAHIAKTPLAAPGGPQNRDAMENSGMGQTLARQRRCFNRVEPIHSAGRVIGLARAASRLR